MEKGIIGRRWYRLNNGDVVYIDFPRSVPVLEGFKVGETYSNMFTGPFYVEINEFLDDSLDTVMLTDKEIEAEFEKEATKRGYKEGIKIECILTKRTIVTGSGFKYCWPKTRPRYHSFRMGEAIIYFNGAWANIIK